MQQVSAFLLVSISLFLLSEETDGQTCGWLEADCFSNYTANGGGKRRRRPLLASPSPSPVLSLSSSSSFLTTALSEWEKLLTGKRKWEIQLHQESHRDEDSAK